MKTQEPISLQQMREEFKQKLGETALSIQTEEEEPSESEDIMICGESPSQIVWTHQQHWADYIQISVEKEVLLTLGEDRVAPLITEVHFVYVSIHTLTFKFSPNSSCSPASFLIPFSFWPCKRSILQIISRAWLSYFTQM